MVLNNNTQELNNNQMEGGVGQGYYGDTNPAQSIMDEPSQSSNMLKKLIANVTSRLNPPPTNTVKESMEKRQDDFIQMILKVIHGKIGLI